MDALRLLSRSTKRTSKSKPAEINDVNIRDRDIAAQSAVASNNTTSRKRKREHNVTGLPDFFAANIGKPSTAVHQSAAATHLVKQPGNPSHFDEAKSQAGPERAGEAHIELTEDERKRILRSHKLKLTWLNVSSSMTAQPKRPKKSKASIASTLQIFPQPFQDFSELPTFDVSSRLVENVLEQGFTTPTEVQIASLPLLLRGFGGISPQAMVSPAHDVDLLTVAPTGSGKTLAFLLPLIQKLYQFKHEKRDEEKQTLAIILAPTKELVAQIVREGKKLVENTGVKIAQTRKGMRLPGTQKEVDDIEANQGEATVVKTDILVSTPGLLSSMLEDVIEGERGKALPGVRNLVLDEADVLLDPLFREQTLSVWGNLSNPALRVGMWSATMGSNVEELARSVIGDRLERLRQVQVHSGAMTEAPLIRLVVGLKDSAIPNVEHRLVYAATEQGKLMGLRQILHPTSSKAESATPLIPPFLIFTQTIERAVALHSELLYDIPVEAGGASRIAVLHSDLSDTARENIMKSFRKGETWVLITTDLLSRGIDFRGVNGVVNYDMPTSSASYVHRVGRTGRAGRQGGIGITLYSKEDIPYMRNVVNVVVAAQKQKNGTDTTGSTVPQWLLDSLPSLAKKDKQKLKKHGVQSRTSGGDKEKAKSGKKTQISTKAGFQRRMENNKKGAIRGSQRRQASNDVDNGSDFGGFD